MASFQKNRQPLIKLFPIYDLITTLLKKSTCFFRTRKTRGNSQEVILRLVDFLKEFENPREFPHSKITRGFLQRFFQ